MTKMTLKWRLSKLPTVEELGNLIKDKVITQEEARTILFNEQDEVERDVESYKSEIKFLREIVEKMASDKSQITTIIKEVQLPLYKKWEWVNPYVTWCDGGSTSTYTSGSSIPFAATGGSGTSGSFLGLVNQAFRDIETF